ncbi:MAG: acetylornithine deacetylase [Enterobacterales bacterium]|nr:acetylornithine deacetylase [Enterobacterales bacterium]
MDTNPIFKHLKQLVAFDTQNPPREFHACSPIIEYLKANLTGFHFDIIDAGDGCLALLAVRGQPDILFNFHIDTVPVAKGWSSDPFELIEQGDRLVGLGACDIKGASACMLVAANQTQGDLALLFSTDEEAGTSLAVKAFLKTCHGFKKVIVSEPTKAAAVVAHRGIQTAVAYFNGISGHASEARALKDNAIHKAGHWIAKVTEWIEQQSDQVENLSGVPFNIGTIEGGIKANMIASDCQTKFGFRPLPGQSSSLLLELFSDLAGGAKIEAGFFGPSLPAANQDFQSAMQTAKDFALNCGLPLGPAVNFWTEASLFSEAGLTALVYGPGDIAQAHTANEWVAIEQLEQVLNNYITIIENQDA